jgi:NADH:ubiquinone oxidoreductase subunit 4 (subunit M)
VRQSFFGPFDEKWSMLKDATTPLKKFPYVLLLAGLMVVGFWPRILTDIIRNTVQTTIVDRLSPGGEEHAASEGAAHDNLVKR